MVLNMRKMWRCATLVAGATALCLTGAGSVAAQSYQQGGNQQGIDSDLVRPDQGNALPPVSPAPQGAYGSTYAPPPAPVTPAPMPRSGMAPDGMPPANPERDRTYHKDDLIGAAEGVFGTGAKGLAQILQDILKKQGEPNGYIVGREAGGAFAVGLRYGSGTMYHKVEGQLPVYWTGPSIGFDAGANASKTFVLVYNLYNSDDLFHRFGAGEGQAYMVGGFNVSYMRRGDVVLIPVRMGVGLRLGINGGYMKFSRKQNWLPF